MGVPPRLRAGGYVRPGYELHTSPTFSALPADVRVRSE